MDVRASNTLTCGGRIEALIDWSNSLVGDPALELARIAEYSRLPENAIDLDEFRRGYASVRPVPDRREECWTLYHLDTAIMLAIVFTHESPHSERGASMLRRVSELASAWV
jgi:aminoglycoside phosphotransferase (APT) family kinase protein